MDENISLQVNSFIASRLNVSLETLMPDTRLREDLGVDGDDAIEFLEDFAETFGVDMTDFRFSKHFGPEAGFNPFYYAYISLLKKRKVDTSPITISDLTTMAAAKRWTQHG
jgi:acyl carrier protein